MSNSTKGKTCKGVVNLFILNKTGKLSCTSITKRKLYSDLSQERVYFIENVSWCKKKCAGSLCAYRVDRGLNTWKFGMIVSMEKEGIKIASFQSIISFFDDEEKENDTDTIGDIENFKWKTNKNDNIEICYLNQLNGCTSLLQQWNKHQIVSKHDNCIKCSKFGPDQIKRSLLPVNSIVQYQKSPENDTITSKHDRIRNKHGMNTIGEVEGQKRMKIQQIETRKSDNSIASIKDIFDYKVKPDRKNRPYLKFAVNRSEEVNPGKNMMAVPFVGQQKFEYITIDQKLQKMEQIAFAYLPRKDVKELQSNEKYSFEEHNNFLKKYKTRTLYCINPANYEFDIGLSMVSFSLR